MDPEEQLLIKLIKAGDERAFEQVFHAHYMVLSVYAKKILGDLDKAKEVVQGVFVKLYEKREEIHIEGSLRAYLFRAVHNACLNQVKKVAVYENHHQEIKYATPFYEDADMLVQTELEEKIWQSVSNLPDQCRKIFNLSRVDGKRNREIADELGLSIRTVETQISKALKLIRIHLKDFLILILSVIASVTIF